MKKIIVSILFLCYSILAKSQISEGDLINVHTATKTEINTLNPSQGTLIYNTIDKSLYAYNGTIWENHKNLETTYETVAIGTGNQTINVRDASKIIGFTFISNYNSLSTSTGKMSKTWMVHNDRDILRCVIQTLEHPYLKTLATTVQIDNAANTITISNYTSRYWTVTSSLPQNRFSNNGTNYRLGKIVIIRKE